jgi:predicted SprT family Zn-dependent metalloprotease
MVAARRPTKPAPPPRQAGPIIYGSPLIQHWLTHYWQKLQLPTQEMSRLAITQNRQEFMRWTGKRLNIMVLGCYCYLPAPPAPRTHSHKIRPLQSRSGLVGDTASELHAHGHRHLIFIEPDMQPKSIEVTVAHELIHLADRVNGTPRRHRHHGYDSIAADEAEVTGYEVDELRRLLHEESARREHLRRERRPIRYYYECPNCGKEYPRTRRYSQSVSCSSCDKSYNPKFRLLLRS